tara:strand:- start:2948 stop:3334 length:387 start_codon:yes stop_codon:yes gene_type:complete
MPIYLYEHPKTQEVTEIIQGMNDDHTFIDKEGVEWNRIYSLPQLACEQINIDPWDNKSFVHKTGAMKGNYGDLLDYSADLSKQRAQENGGVDPVQNKHFRKYEKKTGQKHLKDKKKTFENKNFKIDFD